MKLVMLKNALIISEVRSQPKLRIEGVSNGSVHQTISQDMSKTGETLSYKWASYGRTLIQRLDKCRKRCRRGTCLLPLWLTSKELRRTYEKYSVLAKRKPCKDGTYQGQRDEKES